MTSVQDLASVQTGSGSGRIWVEYVGDVAVIRMERGENRMNDLFVDGFNAALDDILTKTNVKAVITTGTGKFFSNGLDLPWLMAIHANVPDYINTWFQKFVKLQARFLTFPILTIAALNGHTFAGGALFSMVHDYRVMSTDRGWWCLNEVFLNMRFSSWMIRLMTQRLTSPRTAMDAIVYGRRFTAAEAKEVGVIDLVSSGGDLIHTARSLVKELVPDSGIDRGSLTNMKTDFNADILRLIDEIIKQGVTNKFASENSKL